MAKTKGKLTAKANSVYMVEEAAEKIAEKMGLELVEAPVASTTGSFARHDPDQLARVLLEIYRHRVVRIFRGERRYILEE